MTRPNYEAMRRCSEERLRELVAEQFREWPKTVTPPVLLELLDKFARKVLAAKSETPAIHPEDAREDARAEAAYKRQHELRVTEKE